MHNAQTARFSVEMIARSIIGPWDEHYCADSENYSHPLNTRTRVGITATSI